MLPSSQITSYTPSSANGPELDLARQQIIVFHEVSTSQCSHTLHACSPSINLYMQGHRHNFSSGVQFVEFFFANHTHIKKHAYFFFAN